jgi:hypothetical protein
MYSKANVVRGIQPGVLLNLCRKVAGSIPEEVTEFCNLSNPSSRTIDPGVDSASNRNEYQEYFWG